MFGKKKKDAPKEEPVVTKVQEATEHEPNAAPEAPAQEAPQLTPEQARAALLVQEFDRNYNGVVTNAPDHVRASLLFAVYGELYELVNAQHKTNELLEQILEQARKE